MNGSIAESFAKAGIVLEGHKVAGPAGLAESRSAVSLNLLSLDEVIQKYEANKAFEAERIGPTKQVQQLHELHQTYAQSVARKIVRRVVRDSQIVLVEIFNPQTKVTTKEIVPEIYIEKWLSEPSVLSAELRNYQVSEDHCTYASALVKAALSPHVSREFRKKLMRDVMYLPEIPVLNE